MTTSNVTYGVETITPAKAQAMLDGDKNKLNRKLRPGVVKKYSRMMFDGDWQNPSYANPIAFTADGTIINAQHRLSAVVATGLTFDFAVVRGCSEEEYKVTDTGAPRSTDDTVGINAKEAALIKTIITTANGWASSNGMAKSHITNFNIKKVYDVIVDDINDVMTLTNSTGYSAWIRLAVMKYLEDSKKDRLVVDAQNNVLLMSELFKSLKKIHTAAEFLSKHEKDVGKGMVLFCSSVVSQQETPNRLHHAVRAYKSFDNSVRLARTDKMSEKSFRTFCIEIVRKSGLELVNPPEWEMKDNSQKNI